jgi:hypothetical protein
MIRSEAGRMNERRLRLVLMIGGAAILLASVMAIIVIASAGPRESNSQCPPDSACVNPGGGEQFNGADLAQELRQIVEDPAATIDPTTTAELREFLGTLRWLSSEGSSGTADSIGLVVAVVGAITGAVAAAAGVASAVAAYRRPSASAANELDDDSAG